MLLLSPSFLRLYVGNRCSAEPLKILTFEPFLVTFDLFNLESAVRKWDCPKFFLSFGVKIDNCDVSLLLVSGSVVGGFFSLKCIVATSVHTVLRARGVPPARTVRQLSSVRLPPLVATACRGAPVSRSSALPKAGQKHAGELCELSNATDVSADHQQLRCIDS
jgi:hypothetical protein